MATEIERKFRVSSDAWQREADAGVALQQAYLCVGPDRSLRVRLSSAGSARLTLKLGADTMAREEFEYDIPLADAREMVARCVGRVVEKRRHRLMHAGHLWEIDVYGGALSGLVLAEVELADAGVKPPLPGWVGAEVTRDPAYLNSTLALEGLPAGDSVR